MSISAILDNSTRGIQANKNAIELTSENIANINTPGYSRRLATFKDMNAKTAKFGTITGSQISEDITRTRNDFIEEQYLTQNPTLAKYQIRQPGPCGVMKLLDGVERSQAGGGELVEPFPSTATPGRRLALPGFEETLTRQAFQRDVDGPYRDLLPQQIRDRPADRQAVGVVLQPPHGEEE